MLLVNPANRWQVSKLLHYDSEVKCEDECTQTIIVLNHMSGSLCTAMWGGCTGMIKRDVERTWSRYVNQPRC